MAATSLAQVASALVPVGTLVGLVHIEDLVAANADTIVETVMDPRPPRLTAGVDEEQAIWQAVHRLREHAGGRRCGRPAGRTDPARATSWHRTREARCGSGPLGRVPASQRRRPGNQRGTDLGVGRGERVFALLGRIPALYICDVRRL
jgi:hypothetical protein